MTAADETPAQPDNESIWTMAYELARDAQAAGLVVVSLRPTTCRHGVEFDVSLWCPDGRLWAEGRGESAEMIREQHIAGFVRYLADAQPDVAPAPDGNAGGADVYREAAWAWANYEGPMGLPDEQRKDLLRLQVEFKARQPNHRAVVDVARSPLLAEIETLRGHILDIDAHATPYGDIPDDPGWVGTYLVTAGALHRALGKIGHSAPKCQAEAQLAEAIRERDAARRQADVLKQQVDDRDADVRTAEGERDEARAEVDGGEWMTEYRHEYTNGQRSQWIYVAVHMAYCAPDKCVKRRVWLGPVEPVTDDGRAT